MIKNSWEEIEILFHLHIELLFYYLENVKWRLDPGGFSCIFTASLLEKIKSIQCYWRKNNTKCFTNKNLEFMNIVTFWREAYWGCWEWHFFSRVWALIHVTRTNENTSFQGMYCFKCIIQLAARTRHVEKRNNHLLSIAIKTKFTVLF